MLEKFENQRLENLYAIKGGSGTIKRNISANARSNYIAETDNEDDD